MRLLLAPLLLVPLLCIAEPAPRPPFSYDFIQLSLSHNRFPGSSLSGIDLDLKKSMNDHLFAYGAFGTGSVGTVYGGAEVENLLVGAGIGIGYRRDLFGWGDLVATAELYQIDVVVEGTTVPAGINAFGAGVGLRGRPSEELELVLFLGHAALPEGGRLSLDLQIDRRLHRRLWLSGGLDLAGFDAFHLGLRSDF